MVALQRDCFNAEPILQDPTIEALELICARESDTVTDPSDRGLLFPVVDWGYEPQLVDFHVAELVQQLAQARRRGDQAERALSQLLMASSA